jgi:hypothetical protein
MQKFSDWTIVIFISMCLLSCVTTMGCVGCNLDKNKVTHVWKLKPQESFGLVTVTVNVEPKECINVIDESKECNVGSLGLLKRTTKSFGSSIVVGNHNESSKTYVLTAAHVCSEDTTRQFRFIPTEAGVSDQYIVNAQQTVEKIMITDYWGNEKTAEVYRTDVPNDLCLLTTHGIWGVPFKVSKTDPAIGQKVFNVAAPHNIWAPGMVLMMDGYYSGRGRTAFYHYTIPARPGSSGSPILTNSGHIVGMVQRAVMNFENLAISTSTQAIREILSTIPEATPAPITHGKLKSIVHF